MKEKILSFAVLVSSSLMIQPSGATYPQTLNYDDYVTLKNGGSVQGYLFEKEHAGFDQTMQPGDILHLHQNLANPPTECGYSFQENLDRPYAGVVIKMCIPQI
jgi:hypothetical protein